MTDWQPITDTEPPVGEVVLTKIDDGRYARNITQLVRGGQNKRLWFFPDHSMYVYYEPTHFKRTAHKAGVETAEAK